MIINPEEHDYRNIYKLMVGLIVPRPIAFVSSISPEGIRNLAPFSFFTGISANPPVICFCPMIRLSDGSRKDTLENIEATKEFVVNVVSEEFAQKMNTCSIEFPPEVDEFEKSRLTPIPSALVKPPRLKESRINMECKLLQIIHVSSKQLGGSIVLGEVLRFHVADDLYEDYKIDPDKLKPIGRMGGSAYIRTTDRFDMARPKTGEIRD
ncbi:MAG: flavin reductase family protein [Acidobacteria bacterium]|nr:MAG: flavin reductase family protein [Acidobacteriota bacterium]